MSQFDDPVLSAVEHWLRDVVVHYNFCPFAGAVLHGKRVRFVRSSATQDAAILNVLAEELTQLEASDQFETTLVVLDQGLRDFADYNQFLDLAEALLDELGYDGQFQLASFHPQYCFADAHAEDASNYTNRAPYPLLHILRESSVEWAVNNHADVDLIPEHNVQRLRAMSEQELEPIKRASQAHDPLNSDA